MKQLNPCEVFSAGRSVPEVVCFDQRVKPDI